MSSSIESERAVLGGLLLDSTLFDKIKDQLTSEDFSVKAFKDIYGAMSSLYKKHGVFDPTIISDYLELDSKQQKDLYELANECVSTANIKAYADIIREKSVQRQLISVSYEIKAAAKNENINLFDLLGFAEKQVKQIALKNLIEICPWKHRLVSFLKEFALEVENTELDELYLRECIVEVNKAFVSTLEHFEECDESE